MAKKPIKLIVILVVAVLVLFGALQLARGFIDAEQYRTMVEHLILERTGQRVTIKGDPSITVFPSPTLYLPGVELRDGDENTDTPVPSLSADMLRIRFSLLSLFSSVPDVTGIVLEHPLLEIRRSRDKIINWGWLKQGVLSNETSEDVSIAVENGSIVYRNARTDKEVVIENINGSVTTGNEPSMQASLSISGHELQFEARTEEGSGGSLPVKIEISSDKEDRLTLEGTANFSDKEPQIKGNVSLVTQNALGWFNPNSQESPPILTQLTDAVSAGTPKTGSMPLTMNGKWEQTGPSIQIGITEFNGLNSAGAGVITAEWIKENPRIEAEFNFSALNYDYWRLLIATAFENKEIVQATGYKPVRDARVNPLPDDITIAMRLNAEQIYFGSQIWEQGRLSATLDHAAITINQFDVQLPGDTSLSMFGIVSQSSTREMRFEGSMETEGKSLRQLFTVFDASALDLPEDQLGAFHVRSNIYVAADQIRLSEADAKLSELQLSGGLVAYYDTMPRLEADVRLRDIDFDYFRDSWRSKQKPGENKEFFLQFDKNQSFVWLKRLKASVDFKVTVDGFRFLERKGENATFRIFAREGNFGIYNVRLNYPEETLEAGFNLEVKGDKPFFNVLLNADTLDTAYFRADPDATPKKMSKGDKRWSEELIDMEWMDGWRGAFDITIGKLTHYDLTWENVKLRAGLDNSLLGIQSLSLNYWGATANINGSLYGGKVPGLSVGFTLYSAEIEELLQSLIGHDNISGKISINGTLSTSGVNPLSWVSQAESEMVFTGRDVKAESFNLQGVTDAVGVSRTAADVLNNVNLALRKGSTDMSISGNINIKNGIARTPGITIKSGNVNGNLVGELKLVPWKIDVTALFQFPSLALENVPTMTVQLSGPIEDPSMGVDTASLEAYVAKRLTGSSIGK